MVSQRGSFRTPKASESCVSPITFNAVISLQLISIVRILAAALRLRHLCRVEGLLLCVEVFPHVQEPGRVLKAHPEGSHTWAFDTGMRSEVCVLLEWA